MADFGMTYIPRIEEEALYFSSPAVKRAMIALRLALYPFPQNWLTAFPLDAEQVSFSIGCSPQRNPKISVRSILTGKEMVIALPTPLSA